MGGCRGAVGGHAWRGYWGESEARQAATIAVPETLSLIPKPRRGRPKPVPSGRRQEDGGETRISG